MALFRSLSLAGLLTAVASCTTSSPTATAPQEPVEPGKPSSQAAASQQQIDQQELQKPDECKPFAELVDQIPHFFADIGVVVTDVLKACETRDGKAGYLAGSGWVAMGFPCSGGGGTVDWRGSFNFPNLVIFNIPNSCPMMPSQQDAVEELVKSRLGMDHDSRLMAYYPFGISYWELADGTDADTGFTIEVVTTGSRQQRWTNYRAGLPISVRLYGRPNSLMPSRYWYEAHVDLLQDSEQKFRLEVKEVKVLDQDAVAKVKNRCLALSPARNCRQAFP